MLQAIECNCLKNNMVIAYHQNPLATEMIPAYICEIYVSRCKGFKQQSMRHADVKHERNLLKQYTNTFTMKTLKNSF